MAIRSLLVLVAVLVAAPAPAQSPPPRAGFAQRWEVGGGVGYLTSAGLGGRDASLRGNGTPPQPYALFATDSRLTGEPLWVGGVGFALSGRLAIEGRLGFSRPELETSVRADAEGASPVTVVERIDQYVVDAGVVFRVDEMRVARLVPYAAGGAGYLRQLHEGLTVIEQGHLYYLGGGIIRDLMTRSHGIVRAAGLRADARVYFLSGGVSVNDRRSRQGSFTAGLFVRF